jgi:hypothetical protein
MILSRDQIDGILAAHNCLSLTWPHGSIARFSPRHAAALLGADLISAHARIEQLETAIKRHKQRLASPGYMNCFDDHADLWELVNDAC